VRGKGKQGLAVEARHRQTTRTQHYHAQSQACEAYLWADSRALSGGEGRARLLDLAFRTIHGTVIRDDRVGNDGHAALRVDLRGKRHHAARGAWAKRTITEQSGKG